MSDDCSASTDRVTDCGCSSSRTACCDGSTCAGTAGRTGGPTDTSISASATATSGRATDTGSAPGAALSYNPIPSLDRHYPPVPSAVAKQHPTTCARCGTRNPDSFVGRHARLCHDCRLVRMDDSWCRQCGCPLPLAKTGEPRRCCNTNPCQRSLIRTTRPYAHLGRYATGPKECPRCHQTYPRTTEYWYRQAQRKDGTWSLDGYCKQCRKAKTRQVYQTNEGYRQQTLARAAAQRKRIAERRAVDPEFDREYRARVAAWGREERKFRRERDTSAVVPSGGFSADLVDARPVAVAMVAHAVAMDSTIEVVFGPALSRARRRWRSENMRASSALVDRVLLVMDLLWWDIYDPQGEYRSVMSAAEWVDAVDEASYAFEGERLLG